MQTITIELTDKNSLKALLDMEHKNLIRILKESDLTSIALPGEPMSEEYFEEWVEHTELSPTVSHTEAKHRWAEQKKKLQSLIR